MAITARDSLLFPKMQIQEPRLQRTTLQAHGDQEIAVGKKGAPQLGHCDTIWRREDHCQESTADRATGGPRYLLALGTDAVGNLGIQINANAVSPSTDSGTFEWAQIATKDVETATAGSTTTTGACTVPALDTRFPATTGKNFGDYPSLSLVSSNSKETWSLALTTYFMWDPMLTSSIPVPLGSVSWQAFGDATQSNSTWTVNQSDSSASAGGFQAGPSFQNWKNVVTPGTPCQ